MSGEVVNGMAPSKGLGPVTKFSVSCSVCLEVVTEDGGERSIAKLKCGHHFHLDCIGSAFNAKGRMQCPNCRQVEPGQWLYASGCFLHEDFVDDLAFEEEVEAYGGATNLHFSPAPWCPHQGSFAQFSLTFEELDNFSNGYVDLRQGTRVSSSVGQICPYLAAQGLSLGGPSPHADDFLGLHIGQHHRSSRNMRRAASFHSTQRNYGQQQASATSGSMPTSYEGSSQSYSPVGGFLQPSNNRQHTLGFLVGSPQSVHAGVSQGTSMNSGRIFGQPPLIQSTQGINSNAHPHSHSHSVNSSRNGFVSSRRTRQSEIPSTPQRASQGSSSEVGWTATEPVHDYTTPLVASNTMGQTSSPLVGGDALGWAAATDSQVDSWTSGMYVPQPSMAGSNHWWWVPTGNSHGQRLVANPAPNSYHHEGQFFGTGLFPRPRAAPVAGFSEQPAEGSYTWGYSGF
eukprot:c10898_g1_i1 orf=447-1811(-)